MANFNYKINSHVAFVLRDSEHNYFIQKSDSMEEFERNVYYLQFRKIHIAYTFNTKRRIPLKALRGIVSDGSVCRQREISHICGAWIAIAISILVSRDSTTSRERYSSQTKVSSRMEIRGLRQWRSAGNTSYARRMYAVALCRSSKSHRKRSTVFSV